MGCSDAMSVTEEATEEELELVSERVSFRFTATSRCGSGGGGGTSSVSNTKSRVSCVAA